MTRTRRLPLQLKLTAALVLIVMTPLAFSAYLIDQLGKAAANVAAGQATASRAAMEKALQTYGEFVEVTEPERLVYTEAMADHGHAVTRVEVEFREDGDRTTVELTHHGIPAGSPGEAGWTAALDHLATRVLPSRRS